jgi:hypothetical protein
MSVVRYNFVNDYHYCGCGEVEDDNGEYVEYADYQKLLDENAQLRAAIERVRALHERETQTSRFGSIVWHLCPHCRDEGGDPLEHPCPTLRALDGDA